MATAGIAWGFLDNPEIFGEYGWRYMVGVCCTPNIVMLFFLPFLPESPRFCVIKGHMDKAKRIFERVAYWNKKPMFALELKREDLDGNGEKKVTGSILQLFSRKMFLSTIIIFILWFIGVSRWYLLVNSHIRHWLIMESLC